MLFLNIDKVHRTIDLFPEEFEYIWLVKWVAELQQLTRHSPFFFFFYFIAMVAMKLQKKLRIQFFADVDVVVD